MVWAFVDYENTGSLKNVDLSCYQRVIVLCGPMNRKFEFGSLPSSQFSRIELIPVTSTGPNNLDFHLAFHLGRFHELADKDVQFRILSNDAGFDGLVSHLKRAGRKCMRISIEKGDTADNEPPAGKAKKNKKKAAKKTTAKKKAGGEASDSLSPNAQSVVSGLTDLDDDKRPKSEAKLQSWIKARLNGNADDATPAAVLKELIAARKVDLADGRLLYTLNGKSGSVTPMPCAPAPPPAAADPEVPPPPPPRAVTGELPF